MDYKDGLIYEDKDTGDKLIFNCFTWKTIIEGTIVKLTNTTKEEASNLFEDWFVFPKTYNEAIYYSHELEYHWAMQIVYGDKYWLSGISTTEPSDYFEWQDHYSEKMNLAKESFEFDS